MKLFFLMIGFFILTRPIQAGEIRTVQWNSKEMISVNLRMGKSTIIRFPEKPINIVIGNQNYYSIEFIGHDISIQTLFEFPTNLFVYTTRNVYGFVLNPSKKNWDDIIIVTNGYKDLFQKSSQGSPSGKKSIKSLETAKASKKPISIEIKKISRISNQKAYLIDFTVFNNTSTSLRSRHLKVSIFQSNKKLKFQSFALSDFKVNPNKFQRGRVLIRAKSNEDLRFDIKYKSLKGTYIISKEVLK